MSRRKCESLSYCAWNLMAFGNSLSRTEEKDSGGAGEEVEKLRNWGGRGDHGELPRCWDVCVISPLNFSSTFAIPPLLLHSFNLCQPLSVEWQGEGQGLGWTLGPYCSSGGGGTTARPVDGPPLYNPRPFPVPGFPPNTKQTSSSISFLFRTVWVCRKWGIAPFSWHVSKSLDNGQYAVLYNILNSNMSCQKCPH